MVLSFEDTPLFDWLKKNRFFLLGLTILVVGFQGYQYYAPSLTYAKQAKAWSLFDVLVQDMSLDFEANLAPSLLQAEEYPTIYPWIVFSASNSALARGNMDALETLQPALERLAADDSANRWVSLPDSGEVTSIANILLSRVGDSQSNGPMVWENPTPEGAKVNLVVTSSSGDSYSVSIGLFESAAPAASQAFLEAVNNGALIGVDLSSFGTTLSFGDYSPENEAGIPLERKHGVYHLAGTLSTTTKPGEPGMQEPDSVVVYLQDNFGADGGTTVFGAITEGLESLQEATSTPGAETTYAITEASVL